MTTKRNKFHNYLTTTVNTLICIYFILLAYYSRPHFDDLHFMWKIRDSGLINFISFNYFEWSGRYFAYFIVGIIDKLQYTFDSNLLFPFFFGILGYIITLYVLRKVLKLKGWFDYNIVLLFYWIYIFTTFDFAAFTWYCAMSYFLIGPAHLLFVYFSNNHNKISIREIPVVVLLCIFLGAGYEGYTPIVFIISIINLILLLKKHNWKKNALNDIRIKKLLSFNLFIFIFFVLVIIAPGNYIRMNSLQEFKITLTTLQFLKSLVNASFMYAYFSVFNIFYYLFIFILSAYYSYKNCLSVKGLVLSKTHLILITYLFVTIVIANTIIPVYLWGDFGVYRHYIPLNFITILLVAYYGLCVGFYATDRFKKVICRVTSFTLALLIVISLFNLYNDIPAAKAYASEVDKRIEVLKKFNAEGYSGVLKINSLKNIPYTQDSKYLFLKSVGLDKNRPVLYYISDVDTNVLDYSIHLRKLYNLNFDIIKSDK